MPIQVFLNAGKNLFAPKHIKAQKSTKKHLKHKNTTKQKHKTQISKQK